jgi:hypothetical protein
MKTTPARVLVTANEKLNIAVLGTGIGRTGTRPQEPHSKEHAEMRRRRFIKLAAAGACAGFGPAASSQAAPEYRNKVKATAFALVGDRFHNSDYIRTALGKTFVRDVGVSIDFTDEVTLLDAENLQGYRLLIIFRDPFIWPDGYGAPGPDIVSEPPLPEYDAKSVRWPTPEQGKAVKQFVADGASVLFYHNTTYIASGNQDFRDVLGAATRSHPPIRPFKVKITNSSHPITRGVSDFVVTDEQHFMHYDKDPKYVLMRSVNEDGLTLEDLGNTCEAGWAYEYGKGRVCYLAPGHMLTALWNPEYEKLQRNAVRWLLAET